MKKMKKTILISLLFALSLNIANWLNLAEEIKEKELEKNNTQIENQDTETTEVEEVLEDVFTEEMEKVQNETTENEELIDLNAATPVKSLSETTEELPETGPEEFMLIFLTLFLTSAIFIKNKFKK